MIRKLILSAVLAIPAACFGQSISRTELGSTNTILLNNIKSRQGGTQPLSNLTAGVSQNLTNQSILAKDSHFTVKNAASVTLLTAQFNSSLLDFPQGFTAPSAVINGTDMASWVDFLTIADPNADRIVFWDDSAGIFTYLTVGAGLQISGTTLSATGGSGSTNVTTIASGSGTYGRVIVTNDVTAGNGLTNSAASAPVSSANIAVQNIQPLSTSMAIYGGSSSGALYDSATFMSLDFKNRIAYDSAQNPSFGWNGGPVNVNTQLNAHSLRVTNSIETLGDGSGLGYIELFATNGNDRVAIGANTQTAGTNLFRLDPGTVVAGQTAFRVHSVTAFGPTNIIVLTNYFPLSFVPTVVTGAGGANTNFTLSSTTPEQIINGFTNVSIRGAMGYSSTRVDYWNLTITNLSGSNRTFEWSPVTNSVVYSGVYGTNAPTILTNQMVLMLSVRQRETNCQVGYTYFPATGP